MKLVIQFFNEKDGTRSEALSGTPSEILDALSQIEQSFNDECDMHDTQVSKLDPDDPNQVYEGSYDNFAAAAYAARDAAHGQFERFLDSFVIVILEQNSDDPDDMRVSRIPVLKRENFINVLKEKAQ